MEKQRSKYRSKFSRGLLVVFLFILFPLQLQAKLLSKADIEALQFKPSLGQSLVTGSDIKYEVIVPSVSSSNINVLAPEEMNNVTFKTLKRSDLDGEEGGVKIELWFSFSKKGTYTLKPLSLRIQGINRKISFAPVNIKTNPRDQNPVIVICFKDGKIISSEEGEISSPIKTIATGEKVEFTVFFKYGVQLVNFNWDIPKDCIFTQTKAYEITEIKYKEKSSEEEMIPVSDFEWTVLVPGKAIFPSISMTITSNNGYKGEIRLPTVYFDVIPGENKIEEKKNTMFDQAFLEDVKTDVITEKKELTVEDCQTVAKARIKERKSFLGLKKIYRIDLEKSLDLPYDTDEFPVSFVYLSVIFLIFCLFLFIVFLRKKKALVNIGTSFLIVVSILFLIFSIIQSSALHGVSKGCDLYAIPDSKTESKIELGKGSYVQIKEKSGEWFYVQLGETGGWCKNTDIILIE